MVVGGAGTRAGAAAAVAVAAVFAVLLVLSTSSSLTVVAWVKEFGGIGVRKTFGLRIRNVSDRAPARPS